jgi:hypothetical protein
MLPTPPATPKTPTKHGTSRAGKVIDAINQEFSSAFDQYTLEAYRELFAEYDEDGSGNIDSEELQGLLEASGKKVSAIEIRKLIEEVDAIENGGNGDGLISEQEFLRMLRDNRGPNILSDVTRMRADSVQQRRLELEAQKLKKVEDKLNMDKQKQIRKTQQLANEAERLRLANEEKARQVAEYNQREYDKTTAEKERVAREDAERNALVERKRAQRQAELDEASRIKQAALDEAERLRVQNKKDSDDRINNKYEMDKQKQMRKTQQLANEAERLRLANEEKARQVAEYNQREYDKTTAEKERVAREDAERKALVKKKKTDRKAELAAASKKKAEKIAKAKAAIQAKEDAKRAKLEKKNKGKKRFGLKGVI